MRRIETAPEFDPELLALDPEVRIELFAQARLIQQFGQRGRASIRSRARSTPT